jgi:mRNA-degrading endonuclease toxin of MazEF toxin-antitoxin module
MKRTLPGEIWRVDFGMAAKVRPALILSDLPLDDELALLVMVPHTTAIRSNRWEISIPQNRCSTTELNWRMENSISAPFVIITLWRVVQPCFRGAV